MIMRRSCSTIGAGGDGRVCTFVLKINRRLNECDICRNAIAVKRM